VFYLDISWGNFPQLCLVPPQSAPSQWHTASRSPGILPAVFISPPVVRGLDKPLFIVEILFADLWICSQAREFGHRAKTPGYAADSRTESVRSCIGLCLFAVRNAGCSPSFMSTSNRTNQRPYVGFNIGEGESDCSWPSTVLTYVSETDLSL